VTPWGKRPAGSTVAIAGSAVIVALTSWIVIVYALDGAY
jgi:hypothetical protein